MKDVRWMYSVERKSFREHSRIAFISLASMPSSLVDLGETKHATRNFSPHPHALSRPNLSKRKAANRVPWRRTKQKSAEQQATSHERRGLGGVGQGVRVVNMAGHTRQKHTHESTKALFTMPDSECRGHRTKENIRPVGPFVA